jgi:uncharacterized membrane protein
MSLLIEQLIVGIYTSLIYILLKPFGLEYFTLLFLDGFIKHLLGYYIGIQDIYCNKHKPGTISSVSIRELIIESICEGVLFIILGFIFINLGLNKYIVPYIIAFSVHIIVHFIGLHYLFIENRCKIV